MEKLLNFSSNKSHKHCSKYNEIAIIDEWKNDSFRIKQKKKIKAYILSLGYGLTDVPSNNKEIVFIANLNNDSKFKENLVKLSEKCNENFSIHFPNIDSLFFKEEIPPLKSLKSYNIQSRALIIKEAKEALEQTSSN